MEQLSQVRGDLDAQVCEGSLADFEGKVPFKLKQEGRRKGNVEYFRLFIIHPKITIKPKVNSEIIGGMEIDGLVT